MHRKPNSPAQPVSSRRVELVVVIAVAAIMALALIASATAKAQTRAFGQFQGKLCSAFSAQSNASSKYVVLFDQYYTKEPTPENLEAAGRTLQREYQVYRRHNQRIKQLTPPARSRQTWAKYNWQESQVLRFGFQGARALMQADNASFLTAKSKNESWQRKRNATFGHLGVDCS